MQKIVSHLWFDTQAREAAEFYVSVFGEAAVLSSSVLDDTPSGTVEILSARLLDREFMLMSAGPYFSFTPAVSFMVSCSAKAEVDRLWKLLVADGEPLMELGAYPFSERYGWIQDRYGLSWQLMYAGGRGGARRVTPAMMFTGANAGKAEEAVRFYTRIFRNSAIGEISRYGPGAEPNGPNMVNHLAFALERQAFSAMDSSLDHGFSFNEAISFVVHCDGQEEIDYYWNALSASPEAEQCGWLKDRYGFSWQIVPRDMDALMRAKDPARQESVTQAMLAMKKLDIEGLRKAARS